MCVHARTCVQTHAYTLISTSTYYCTHRHCMWFCTHIHILADIHLVRHISCNACTPICDPFLAARVYLSVPLHMEGIFYILHPAKHSQPPVLCSVPGWCTYRLSPTYWLSCSGGCRTLLVHGLGKAGLPTLALPCPAQLGLWDCGVPRVESPWPLIAVLLPVWLLCSSLPWMIFSLSNVAEIVTWDRNPTLPHLHS